MIPVLFRQVVVWHVGDEEKRQWWHLLTAMPFVPTASTEFDFGDGEAGPLSDPCIYWHTVDSRLVVEFASDWDDKEPTAEMLRNGWTASFSPSVSAEP